MDVKEVYRNGENCIDDWNHFVWQTTMYTGTWYSAARNRINNLPHTWVRMIYQQDQKVWKAEESNYHPKVGDKAGAPNRASTMPRNRVSVVYIARLSWWDGECLGVAVFEGEMRYVNRHRYVTDKWINLWYYRVLIPQNSSIDKYLVDMYNLPTAFVFYSTGCVLICCMLLLLL